MEVPLTPSPFEIGWVEGSESRNIIMDGTRPGTEDYSLHLTLNTLESIIFFVTSGI